MYIISNARQTNKYIQEKDKLSIIYIQSVWRGYQIRRIIKYLKSIQKVFCYYLQNKYFTIEEAHETLTGAVYNPNTAIVKRSPYLYKTGAVYAGTWKGGFRHGFGEMQWIDGAKYEGQWEDNCAHGSGKFFHVDGDIYEGRWAYDKANGYGKYMHNNGAMYEGTWRDDVQHGEGKERWADGASYEGNYSYGKKEGKGTYIWSDKSSYTGEWEDNNICGKGVYKWSDGKKYTGEWKDNNMNGFGLYEWIEGRKYLGFYVNDQKQGYGKYLWNSTRQFQGWWYRNRQHGVGKYVESESKYIMYLVDKVKYGLWEEGKRIKWFTAGEVQAINEGTLDYTTFFELEKSRGEVSRDQLFEPPLRFVEAQMLFEKAFPDLSLEEFIQFPSFLL